ncbi:MAG TPA: hypothetical protein VD866_28555 [Urbifossiella sp.]|nr:hypothetical protein [Urbifossiella sp.]
MSALLAELPADLRAVVTEAASRSGVSEAAWLAEAAREKLAAAQELAYLAERAERGSRVEYDRVLSKVPASPPERGDERS